MVDPKKVGRLGRVWWPYPGAPRHPVRGVHGVVRSFRKLDRRESGRVESRATPRFTEQFRRILEEVGVANAIEVPADGSRALVATEQAAESFANRDKLRRESASGSQPSPRRWCGWGRARLGGRSIGVSLVSV